MPMGEAVSEVDMVGYRGGLKTIGGINTKKRRRRSPWNRVRPEYGERK
jgi:hypothetical protein